VVARKLAVAYMHGKRDAGIGRKRQSIPAHGAVVAASQPHLPLDRRELPDLSDDTCTLTGMIANALPAVMVAHVVFPAGSCPGAFRLVGFGRVYARFEVQGG